MEYCNTRFETGTELKGLVCLRALHQPKSVRLDEVEGNNFEKHALKQSNKIISNFC